MNWTPFLFQYLVCVLSVALDWFHHTEVPAGGNLTAINMNIRMPLVCLFPNINFHLIFSRYFHSECRTPGQTSASGGGCRCIFFATPPFLSSRLHLLVGCSFSFDERLFLLSWPHRCHRCLPSQRWLCLAPRVFATSLPASDHLPRWPHRRSSRQVCWGVPLRRPARDNRCSSFLQQPVTSTAGRQ